MVNRLVVHLATVVGSTLFLNCTCHADPIKVTAASDFAKNGPATTLSICQLPETCNNLSPSEKRKTIQETSNDTLIEKRELHFQGLKVELIYVLGDSTLPAKQQSRQTIYEEPFITSLIVTSPDWPIWNGLKVGSSRSSVEGALGKTGTGAADECVTYANEDSQDEAIICYEAKKVVSIEWRPWWDG